MIDLHIHTKYSDGVNSVKEILLLSHNLDLNTISITDHDTTLAYNELLDINYKELFSGNIMFGIEISSKYKGHKIELLAYNFDNYKLINNNVRRDSYRNNKKMHDIIRDERIGLIYKFKSLGLVVDYFYLDNLFIDYFESRLYNSLFLNNNINTIKDRLGDCYYEAGYDFFRKCVTNPDTPFYIDYSELNQDINEICDLIHDNDGLVFLAHPLLYGIKDLKKMFCEYPNIDGLECYYNGFNKDEIDSLVNLAKDNNLLISGGSDYHGKKGFKNQLGHSMLGKSYIDDNIMSNWNIKIKTLKK